MISLYVNTLLCTLQHIVMQISGVNPPNWHHTAELHRVYDNMLQCAQNCIDVQGDHFQHLLLPVSTLHLHLFNFLYTVRDLRPLLSTRRRTGFSCATLYNLSLNTILFTLHFFYTKGIPYYVFINFQHIKCFWHSAPFTMFLNEKSPLPYHHGYQLGIKNTGKYLSKWNPGRGKRFVSFFRNV